VAFLLFWGVRECYAGRGHKKAPAAGPGLELDLIALPGSACRGLIWNRGRLRTAPFEIPSGGARPRCDLATGGFGFPCARPLPVKPIKHAFWNP